MNIRLKIIVVSLAVLGLVMTLSSCSLTPSAYHAVKFMNHGCISPLAAYNYKTCDDLKVDVDGKELVIPKGFETDLASIPKWYWSIISPSKSEIIEPSILHDYYYRCAKPTTRLYADEVFYYAMLQKGVDTYTAGKLYLAVRIFGEGSYDSPSKCIIDPDQMA